MDVAQLKELANLLLPDVTKTPEYFEELFPSRKLPHNAQVTRFAPSPTGFLHVGGLYASLVSSRIARQTQGVYYLRIEDTDKKREIENGVSDLITALSNFDVKFDEGINFDGSQTGDYGPYKQSERRDIYRTFVKDLIMQGLAYPCFCSESEIDAIRQKQEKESMRQGYYGTWACCRCNDVETVRALINDGVGFVVRLKSHGKTNETVTLHDRIKGEIELPENDQDIVLLKSDGIPTYHFAHVIDDHLMRTTIVIRGDEWLSSAPIHLQLFEYMQWVAPSYAHISPIQKEENGAKRKLSKRKDPEASVSFYHESGIPTLSLTEYLLNLANSSFEDWRRDNPDKHNTQFNMALEKMSVSGALFDMVKLLNISKNIVGNMSAKEVLEEVLNWSNEHDKDLFALLSSDKDFALNILNIERNVEKPRKDIAKWSDVRVYLQYFFDNEFEKEVKLNGYGFSDRITIEDIRSILKTYSTIYNADDDKDVWFSKLKNLAQTFGFSPDVKAYKKNPEQFKGHIGDIAEIVRIAIANRKNTPDLMEVMKVMGQNRVNNRFEKV